MDPWQKNSQVEGYCPPLAVNVSSGTSNPNTTTSPCGDDVGQLRRVRGDFDRDGFEVEVLLLSVDGVRAGRYVLQAERAIGFCLDCKTKTHTNEMSPANCTALRVHEDA